MSTLTDRLVTLTVTLSGTRELTSAALLYLVPVVVVAVLGGVWLGLATALFLGLGGIGVAIVFGHLLLTLIYRPEYAEHTDLLVTMMVAGALTYVGSVFASAVTSARAFNPQIPVLASAVSAGAIASYLLIRPYGLLGAGFAVVVTSAVLCAGHGILLLRVRRNALKEQPAVALAS